jgi:hypothetical protein
VWSLAVTEITTATQNTVPINGTIAIWPVWSVSLKFLCPWQHSAGWTCGGPAGCCSKLHTTHATLPPEHGQTWLANYVFTWCTLCKECVKLNKL